MEQFSENQIIVFGGSFNPPTKAHENIMRACLELPEFDEVWIMPSGDRFDKQMNVTDQDRLNMLNIIKESEFNNDPRLLISNFELNLPKPNQTINTIGALAALHLNNNYWFAYGTDSYWSMPGWSNGKVIQNKQNQIIINRGDQEVPKRKGIINLYVDQCESISSTEVRVAINNRESIKNFVSSAIENYIVQKKLYILK